MKISVVGCGTWGPNLMRTFNNMGCLLSVHDISNKNMDRFRNDPVYRDVKFTNDYRDAFAFGADAVAVATPPASHHKIAMVALGRGKHVFIEKPMTLDVKEAEEIVHMSKGLTLMTGHIFLYSPEIRKLKQIIMSDDFGDVQYVYLKRLNLGKIQTPANVIDDLIPHDVSILNYVLNSECTEVSAVAKNHVLDTADVAFVNMRYGDVLCNLHLSWLDPLKVRDTVIVGSKQMVTCDSVNKSIHLYNKGVDLSDIEKGMNTYDGHLLSYRYGDEIVPYIKPDEPMRLECEDFVESIRTGRRPISDGELGLSVVKVLSAVQTSAKHNGAWVSL